MKKHNVKWKSDQIVVLDVETRFYRFSYPLKAPLQVRTQFIWSTYIDNKLEKEERLLMESNKVLDAKGLACPMPVVRARKVMKEMETGEVLEIQCN